MILWNGMFRSFCLSKFIFKIYDVRSWRLENEEPLTKFGKIQRKDVQRAQFMISM